MIDLIFIASGPGSKVRARESLSSPWSPIGEAQNVEWLRQEWIGAASICPNPTAAVIRVIREISGLLRIVVSLGLERRMRIGAMNLG